MQFPLSFSDINLWLSITAIILLTISEFISPYCGKTNILINKKRLRRVALLVGTLFMFTVLIQIYGIMTML